jgi:hypothetical protein
LYEKAFALSKQAAKAVAVESNLVQREWRRKKEQF